jgi:hypothetical protein
MGKDSARRNDFERDIVRLFAIPWRLRRSISRQMKVYYANKIGRW